MLPRYASRLANSTCSSCSTPSSTTAIRLSSGSMALMSILFTGDLCLMIATPCGDPLCVPALDEALLTGRARKEAIRPHARAPHTRHATAQSQTARSAYTFRGCLRERRTGWETEIHTEAALARAGVQTQRRQRQVPPFVVLPEVRLGDGHGVDLGSTGRIEATRGPWTGLLTRGSGRDRSGGSQLAQRLCGRQLAVRGSNSLPIPAGQGERP